MDVNLFILASIAFLYGIVAKKVESNIVSGPIVFVVLGLVLGPYGFNFIDIGGHDDLLSTFAELTLALVLFTDASSSNMKVLLGSAKIPGRLLLIGLPLTIVMGILVGMLLFPQFLFVEVAILAIILAPTDAALGKAVVSNPKVPAKIRESLNVESGLNDGICVPFLLLCMAIVSRPEAGIDVVNFFVQSIGIGVVVGLVITYFGAFLFAKCLKLGWASESWAKVLVIALAFSIFGLSETLGGSGFIACFTGGILFGIIAKKERDQLLQAAEGIGDSFALATWTLFGAIMIGSLYQDIELVHVLYAVLSLTIIRILPVMLSLIRTGVKTNGQLFISWFGPRGLASIVFVVMIADTGIPNENEVTQVVVLTILLSVITHGLSANPYAKWIGSHYKE